MEAGCSFQIQRSYANAVCYFREKTSAYRKLYALLFEDGERLPTLIDDAEESENFNEQEV